MKKKSQSDVVQQAVRRTLRDLETEKNTFSDGEEFICRVCEREIKPCEDDLSYECPDMILGETALHSLFIRGHEISNGLSAICILCGRKLKTRELKANALSELCPACLARSVKTQRGKI